VDGVAAEDPDAGEPGGDRVLDEREVGRDVCRASGQVLAAGSAADRLVVLGAAVAADDRYRLADDAPQQLEVDEQLASQLDAAAVSTGELVRLEVLRAGPALVVDVRADLAPPETD